MTSQGPTRKSPTTLDLMRRRFELMAAEHVAQLGAEIARRRKALGLTQNQLADKIPGKTDGNQVSKWERGSHRPSDDTLEHLAAALESTVFELMGPPPEEPTPELRQIVGAPARADLASIAAEVARQGALLDAIVAHLGIKVEDFSEIPFGPVVGEHLPPNAASAPGARTASAGR